jgi:hypothetical protein
MAEARRIQRQRSTAATVARKGLQRKVQEHQPVPASRKSHAEILHIQRTQGNEAVERLLRARRAQRAATVEGDGREAGLRVEIADTPEQRHEGLRNRRDLPGDQGLLFLKEQARGHTMEETDLRLSIAYLDRWGKVLEIRDGEPGQGPLAPPTYHHRHALEVRRGWFAEHGLGEGSRVRLDGAPMERPEEKAEQRGTGGTARLVSRGATAAVKGQHEEEEEAVQPGTMTER